MKQYISRRKFMQITVAALAVPLIPLTSQGPPVSTLDYCYWKKLNGPYCRQGVLYEDWGYRCCAGGVCEYETYETRQVGYC